jgi:hypothetical protein
MLPTSAVTGTLLFWWQHFPFDEGPFSLEKIGVTNRAGSKCAV